MLGKPLRQVCLVLFVQDGFAQTTKCHLPTKAMGNQANRLLLNTEGVSEHTMPKDLRYTLKNRRENVRDNLQVPFSQHDVLCNTVQERDLNVLALRRLETLQ